MTRGRTYRLRIASDSDKARASRAIDVMSTTPLDVVAQALRAVSSKGQSTKQYRMEIDGKLYGNPPGRSHPNVRRGQTTSLEKALGQAISFHFRSDLSRKTGYTVYFEHVFLSLWPPEDHPLLVDIDGEIPVARTPSDSDDPRETLESSEQTESRTRPKVRLIDNYARLYLVELTFVRNPRRGPIRSHQSGQRGWRERIDAPTDPVMEGLRRHGNETLESFACSGEGYDATSYSYFEQRPCLIEQVYLETILWCTRNRCPGCRGNHVDEQLFAGSEVWTTTRHGKPAARNRDDYILNIHRKPENRVTVRVSHPAGNRIETMESIKRWKTRMDPDHHKRLGIWVAEDGCSWRGPRERTAVLYQPADLPGPPGWERAE